MRFETQYVGSEGLSSEDRAYRGSRYAEVREALLRNAYYLTWGAQDEPPLPVYGVTLGRVLSGILPFGRPWQFGRATGRALDALADLRWGHDRRGFRRLLHPNGVCLFGRWIIDRSSPYSGYFEQGKEALIVARYSVCCSETRRGHYRSQSIVGKLFPTTDPAHTEPLKTANFITQEDLGGSWALHINDVELRNAPDVTPWRRGFGLPILLLTGLAFRFVDRMTTQRQLYPIAELGQDPLASTKAPQFMRLTVADDHRRIPGEDLDFRDEILAHIYDRGISQPRRKLTFTIEVADVGRARGLFARRVTFPQGWQTIGRIEFDEAVASYNGDFVLHFHHPPWRSDRNNPLIVVRRPRND